MQSQPEFLTWEIVAALHGRSLERWGGLAGVRDKSALESALGAAENIFFYGGGDVHDVAAAYAYHLAESQGFVDGNKRTGIACAAVFLLGNGCEDQADDAVLYDAMIAISARRMNKGELAEVLRRQFPKA